MVLSKWHFVVVSWNIRIGQKYLQTLQVYLYLSHQPSHVTHSIMVSLYHDVCVQQMWVQ